MAQASAVSLCHRIGSQRFATTGTASASGSCVASVRASCHQSLGRYHALHHHFVTFAVRSFGLRDTRNYDLEDARKMMAEKLVEAARQFHSQDTRRLITTS